MKETLINKNSFLDFEIKFLRSLTLMSAIVGGISVIVNIFIGLSILMILLPTLVWVFYVIFYYWSRTGKWVLPLKILYSFITMSLLNLIWIQNGGSHGPSPTLFVLIFSVMLFIWSGKELLIMTFIFFINVLVIFFIDNRYPDLIQGYKSEPDRFLDVLLGVIVFGGVIFILINNAKKGLMEQYLEAKRSDRLKSAFLANMSHEIRTPMNAIYGFSQVLKDPSFTEEEKKQYIDLICNQTDYLLSIINELIDISKIESGALKLHEDVADLNDIISKMPDTLNHLRKESVEVKIFLEKESADLKINIDSTRLRQVITNLMSNALKYTFNGYVELGYQLLDNKFIQIYVKDTGIGIAQKDAGKIFDRFYQVESKNKTVLNEGTGLGLPIASALAKHMGGEMWVESVEHEGTIFFFTIPYKPVNTDKVPKTMPAADLKGSTIMIVDNHKNNYLFLKQSLSNINAKAIWMPNGKEAVKYVKNKHKVDLILMETKLPEMDGYNSARKIKQLNGSIPIIAQSIFTAEHEQGKAMEAGCYDYISKPIQLNQLIEILKKYLTNI
jgi:signal transduction histidine kinase